IDAELALDVATAGLEEDGLGGGDRLAHGCFLGSGCGAQGLAARGPGAMAQPSTSRQCWALTSRQPLPPWPPWFVPVRIAGPTTASRRRGSPTPAAAVAASSHS